MAVVVFNYADFVAQYPAFVGVSSQQAQGFFNRACLYFENETTNPAFTSGNMATLLYLLTAHVAQLSSPRDANGNPVTGGQPAPGLVGRISSANQGSVSVSAEWKGSGTPSEEWYIQTPYGAEFWQATAQYRTWRYGANPTMVAGPLYPYAPRYRRW